MVNLEEEDYLELMLKGFPVLFRGFFKLPVLAIKEVLWKAFFL
jgi:hypothetical protein